MDQLTLATLRSEGGGLLRASASHFAVFASAVVVFLELYYSALSAVTDRYLVTLRRKSASPCVSMLAQNGRSFSCSMHICTVLLSVCVFLLCIVYSVTEESFIDSFGVYEIRVAHSLNLNFQLPIENEMKL